MISAVDAHFVAVITKTGILCARLAWPLDDATPFTTLEATIASTARAMGGIGPFSYLKVSQALLDAEPETARMIIANDMRAALMEAIKNGPFEWL